MVCEILFDGIFYRVFVVNEKYTNSLALADAIETDTVDTIGGIFRDGSFGWIVVGAHIEIVSLKNGNRIAEYTFGDRR